jgi:hypothetical protein
LPPDWLGFEADVRMGESTTHVIVHNRRREGAARVELDGVPQARPRIEPGGRGDRKLEIWLGGDRRSAPTLRR